MSVAILDYGMGNLKSVWNALDFCGASAVISGDPLVILAADHLVIPGVGAFGDGMRELRRRGLDDAIRTYCGMDRPLLGICLGMQMLFEESEEMGLHRGLGIIPGRVRMIQAASADGLTIKVPHIGWSPLMMPQGRPSWEGTLLRDTPAGAEMYFVHSFKAHPENDVHLLACADYRGHRICAAVRSGNVHGLQFHPERSGPDGLAVIRRFIEL